MTKRWKTLALALMLAGGLSLQPLVAEASEEPRALDPASERFLPAPRHRAPLPQCKKSKRKRSSKNLRRKKNMRKGTKRARGRSKSKRMKKGMATVGGWWKSAKSKAGELWNRAKSKAGELWNRTKKGLRKGKSSRRRSMLGKKGGSSDEPKWYKGAKVSVKWKGKWYNARVVGVIDPTQYLISYDGYAKKWDEVVGLSRIRNRSRNDAPARPKPGSDHPCLKEGLYSKACQATLYSKRPTFRPGPSISADHGPRGKYARDACSEKEIRRRVSQRFGGTLLKAGSLTKGGGMATQKIQEELMKERRACGRR